MLPVAVARSFSGGVVIRYVLPISGFMDDVIFAVSHKWAVCMGAGVTLELPASLMYSQGGFWACLGRG